MRVLDAALITLFAARGTSGSLGDLKAKGAAGGGGAAGTGASADASAGSAGLAGSAGSDAGGGAGGTAGASGAGGSSGAGGTTVGAPCASDGGYACAGAAQARILVCKNGTWQTAQDCTNGQLCDSSLPITQADRCTTPVADCLGQAPGSVVCIGADRVKCGPDLVSTTTLATCDSAELCLLGSGDQCAVCQDGQYRCTGQTLEKCATDHLSFSTVTTCQGAAQCNAGAGSCTTAACVSGQYQCAGAQLQACNNSGTGFATMATCASDNLCDAINGQCDVCVPGAKSCKDSGTSRVCNSDGQGYTDTTCPASAPVCTGQGVCVCQADPISTTCSGKCGTLANNCGDAVDCGNTCTGSDSCGGGGTPNVCGCTVTSNNCGTKVCGASTDNCGNTVSCGTCGVGYTCNNGTCQGSCGGIACPTGCYCDTNTQTCKPLKQGTFCP